MKQHCNAIELTALVFGRGLHDPGVVLYRQALHHITMLVPEGLSS